MNPFKSVSGRCSKRKAKYAKVEVKQEPSFKEEPNDGDSVIDVPRPRVDGRYRANYDRPIDFNDDFVEIKDEIKCEEAETGKDKDSSPCERSNNSAANDDGSVDAQPVDDVKKWNGSSKKRIKRSMPRNQAAKRRKKHKCHVCNHLASDKSQLTRHLRTHTGEKPYQCELCSKSFAHKHHLKGHKKTHGQFRCSKCKQGFEQDSTKIDHERLCNPRRFECDICGYHTVVKSHLTVHMQTHIGEKPFECSICFKSFTSNANLRNHLMSHIDELPNACSKCGQRFATPEDKQTHELRCQRKSIRCEICSKQFVQQIKLKQHLSSTHSDQFPFRCSKCFGGYATNDAKDVHEDSCCWRQYQCHLCEEHSRSKQTLKIHMRKDHTGDRIQCKMCAASFTKKSDANHHMKTVHRSKK